MEPKYTKGNWEPIFSKYRTRPKKICTGVGLVTHLSGGDYIQYICNSILPDSDEEYIKEHEEIEANMKLIAAAPDMFEALRNLILIENEEDQNKIFDTFYKAKQIIKKYYES